MIAKKGERYMLIRKFNAMKMQVNIYDSRTEMGKHVAEDVAAALKALLREKETLNMIFAAAPSQNEFLDSLAAVKGIGWNRINVFHMDEYIGLSPAAPQSFSRFVKEKVADRLPVKNFYAIRGDAPDPEQECRRYAALLQENRPDVVCLGIGENGHIAFNDPHEADFWDSRDVKIVELDEVCRRQQVNDGCFARLDQVPKKAITLTIPAIMRASALFCTVPGRTKAEAVRNVTFGEISCRCPASVLKIHANAKFYCDADSAAYILQSDGFGHGEDYKEAEAY